MMDQAASGAAAARGAASAAGRFVLPTILLATVFLLGITPIHDGDVWWHLKTGQFFFQHRSFPDQDPFVFTAGGDRWIIRAWLTEVIFYLVFRLGGLEALTLFKAALFTLAVGILWRLGVAVRCPPAAAALVLFLAVLVVRPRLAERPEVFSFVLLAVALSILLRGVGGRAVYALVPLQVLWANLHSSFFLGLLLPWLFLVDEAARRLRQRRGSGSDPNASLWPLLFAALLLWPASALTPQGIQLLLYPFHVSRTPTQAEIAEVQGLISMLRVCGGCLEEVIAFTVLVLLTLALFAYQAGRGHGVGPGTWVLVAGSTVAPFLVYRLLPYAAILLAAQAMRGFGAPSEVGKGFMDAERSKGGRPLVAAGMAVLLLVSFAAFHLVRGSRYPFGLGVAPGVFPEGAARFILTADAHGPVYNSLRFGSYLLWALFPRHQVFIHPAYWDSVSDDRLIARFIQSMGDPATFDALVREYRIELLVLPNGRPLWRFVPADPRWALIYWDQVASVYALRGGANAALIAAREFRLTRYAEDLRYLWAVARQPASFAAAKAELRRAVMEDSQNHAARLSLAYLLMARGQDLEEALGAVETLRRNGFGDIHVFTLKAGILAGLGRAAEAEAAAREAIHVWPRAWGARLLLADLRARAGDREDAARHLRDLLGRDDLPPGLRSEAEIRLRALTQ
jgi:hypothetical protein